VARSKSIDDEVVALAIWARFMQQGAPHKLPYREHAGLIAGIDGRSESRVRAILAQRADGHGARLDQTGDT